MKELVNRILILFVITFCAVAMQAQDANLIRGKVHSDLDGDIIGASVVELDANNRILSTAVTDFNGEFSLKVKNRANKLRISYIGYNTQTIKMGNQTVFNVLLEDAMTIKDVVVTARKTTNSGTLDIPTREISTAMQTISSKDFEGLSVASVDDALQGRISGLDVVASSGDAGSGR